MLSMDHPSEAWGNMLFKNRKDRSGRSQTPRQQDTPTGPPVARSNQPRDQSFIARDIVIEGNITSQGELHIDGTIKGIVTADTCIVEQYGKVIGEVHAIEIYIYGAVEGPLVAQHVHVLSGGRVRGDIWQDTISIEHGADVLGQFLRNSQDPAQTTPGESSSAIFEDFYAKARENQSSGENAPVIAAKFANKR
jgi:cytoskeletal protein CcmA (bactofilin family)